MGDEEAAEQGKSHVWVDPDWQRARRMQYGDPQAVVSNSKQQSIILTVSGCRSGKHFVARVIVVFFQFFFFVW